MDGGAWWAIVHGVAKSRTRLRNFNRGLSLTTELGIWQSFCTLSNWYLRRRQWYPTPVLLPGKPHGQGSLVGCSPWGCEESDTTSNFTFTFHFHALEKEMATHSSVLAWRIPGTAEPGGLPSMGSHRVRHDWIDLVVVVYVGSFYLNRDNFTSSFPIWVRCVFLSSPRLTTLARTYSIISNSSGNCILVFFLNLGGNFHLSTLSMRRALGFWPMPFIMSFWFLFSTSTCVLVGESVVASA